MGLRLFGCGVAKTFRSSGQPWDSREDSSHLRDVKCGTELPCHAWTSRRRHCALFPVRWRDERQSWFDIDAVWLHWRMHLNTINGVNDCEWLCIKAVWLHLKQFWLHLEMVLIDRFCVAERRRNGSWRTICLAVLSKILLTKNQFWQKNVLESRSWLDDWRRNAPLNRQKTNPSIFGQNEIWFLTISHTKLSELRLFVISWRSPRAKIPTGKKSGVTGIFVKICHVPRRKTSLSKICGVYRVYFRGLFRNFRFLEQSHRRLKLEDWWSLTDNWNI